MRSRSAQSGTMIKLASHHPVVNRRDSTYYCNIPQEAEGARLSRKYRTFLVDFGVAVRKIQTERPRAWYHPRRSKEDFFEKVAEGSEHCGRHEHPNAVRERLSLELIGICWCRSRKAWLWTAGLNAEGSILGRGAVVLTLVDCSDKAENRTA